MIAAPGDTNWWDYGIRGNLAAHRLYSSQQPAMAPSTERREASTVKAAQKWTTNPSTRDFS
jgi:hypothetical protein